MEVNRKPSPSRHAPALMLIIAGVALCAPLLPTVLSDSDAMSILTTSDISRSFLSGNLRQVVATSISCPPGQKIWDGEGVTENWSEGANWCDDTTPTSGVTIVFNSTSSKNALINVSVDVSSLNIDSGYSGSVSMASGVNATFGGTSNQAGGTFNAGSGTLTFGSPGVGGGLNLSAGTFNAGSGPIIFSSVYTQTGGVFNGSTGDVSGAFSLNGGAFNAPSGTLTTQFDFNISGGTFDPKNGTVVFIGTNRSLTFSSSELTFKNLTINKDDGHALSISGSNKTVLVAGTLTLTEGAISGSSSVFVKPQAAVNVASTFGGNIGHGSITGGTATLLIEGSATPRTITMPAGAAFPHVTINEANATLTATGAGTVRVGVLRLLNGVVNTGSTNLVMGLVTTSFGYFQSGGTFTSGAGNVTLDAGNFQLDAGTFTMTSGNGSFPCSLFKINGGTFQASEASSVTTTFCSSGAVDHGFEVTAGVFDGRGGTLDINRGVKITGGTFNASSGETRFGFVFDHQGGIFDHKNGTVVFDSSHPAYFMNGPASPVTEFNNLTFNLTNPTSGEIALNGDSFVVNGTLRFVNGVVGPGGGTGGLQAKANVIVESGADGGSAQITFNGTSDQTFTNNGGTNVTGTWTINKTTGTVNLNSQLDLSNSANSLVLANGTINTNSNTINAGSRTITRTNGYIIGNLQRRFTATGLKTFDVGTTNGYSPVAANATALGQNPSSLTISAIQGVHPLLTSTPALGRYFSIMETGDLTAIVTFNYLQLDVNGNESNYRVMKIENGAANVIASNVTIDTVSNGFTVNNLSQFSDWTLGEPPPSQLAFRTHPSTVLAGATISPAVEVELRDQFGSVITSATNPVTISIGNNPGSGTLSGTLTRNAVNGVATFNDLSIGAEGVGYTLLASAAGLASTSSNAFNVFSPFVVFNTNDSGAGSLRQAITNANNTAGTQTISFHISGAPPFTITPALELPWITDPVVIDGATQPGFAGTPIIELNGVNIPFTLAGLNISAGNSKVKSLVINRFSHSAAILLHTNGGNTIQGNYIGTNVAGNATLANYNGIYLHNSLNNLIGGDTPNARNVVSGNVSFGVTVWDPNGAATNGTIIKGNYIGTDASGSVAIPNYDGIWLVDTNRVTVGGSQSGERNLISGNTRAGIRISNYTFPALPTSNLTIKGNFIGTNVAGTAAVANGQGIALNPTFGPHGHSINNVTIGGSQPGEGNLISGNFTPIYSFGEVTNLSIRGNYIGTDLNGAVGVPNQNGIYIGGLPTNVVIGGIQNGERNIIDVSSAPSIGIFIGSGTGVSIRGNSIHSNSHLPGIDLSPWGWHNPNDFCDFDAWANNGQNHPELTSVISSAGDTTVHGKLMSAANTTYTVDLYSTAACDIFGRGAGQKYLGSTTVTTSAQCDLGTSFSVTLPINVPSGQLVVATATDPDGNTSEFSPCVGPSAKIEGTVLGGNNQPIRSVQLDLREVGAPDGRWAMTDANGRFTYAALPLGKNYIVTPSKPGYSFNPTSRTYNNLSTNKDDVYNATGTLMISGRVTHVTPRGNFAVSDVTLTLSGAGSQMSLTNGDGNFRFVGLTPGTYTVTPTKVNHTFSPSSTTMTISSDGTTNFTASSLGLDGLSGRFVFESTGDIKAMNANGTGIVTLIPKIRNKTGTTHMHSWPSISPSGDKLVYVRTALANGVSEIWTSASDGTNRTMLLGNGNNLGGVVFSPDGTRIAFHDNNAVRVMNANGTNVVTVEPQCTEPDWSPDSLRLVYLCGGQVFIEDAVGGNRASFDIGNNASASSVQWSSVGTKLAVIRRTVGGENQIFVRNLDGTNPTILKASPTDGYRTLKRSPDGNWLSFIKMLPSRTQKLIALSFDGTVELMIADFGAARMDWGVTNSLVTSPGSNVSLQTGAVSITLTTVNGAAGVTTVTPISPASAGQVPGGFVVAGQAYEISTTANFTPPATVCFKVTSNSYTTIESFNTLSLLHNEGGVLVDRTSSRDFSSRTICGTVSSFSPFVLAQQLNAALPSISGIVVDENGNRLSGVRIVMGGDEERFADTNLDGFFTFANLAPGGNYSVEPADTGYLYNPASQTFVNLSSEQTVVFIALQKSLEVSGTILTGELEPSAGITVNLSGSITLETVTDANGNYSFEDLPANGLYLVKPLANGFSFLPNQFTTDALQTDLAGINFIQTLSLPNPSTPSIFVEADTIRAIALDSVTLVRGPFPILTDHNFSADRHTRVILFTSNLGLTQPDSSVLIVQAAGINLSVENVGSVTGVNGLDASYVVVRLPDGLPSGDLPLTVTLRGNTSNIAILTIRP